MRRILLWGLTMAVIAIVGSTSCRNDKIHTTPQPTPAYGNFPEAVGKIFIDKCATAGCHNAASYQNCNGLLLDSWEHLLEGGNHGTQVVAYSPEYSPLLYFVNTDPARGTVATPTMPYDPSGGTANALSAAEYKVLKDWITAGAPDKDGNIPFATEADTRQKIYIAQQPCDLMAVVDAKSNQVMRYIHIGESSTNMESPHCVRTSADGRYAYVSFYTGSSIEKIDMRTDQVVGSIGLGSGAWNILFITPGDNWVVTTDFRNPGRVFFADAATLAIKTEWTGSGAGIFTFPHGIATNATGDTCIITAQYGNVVYRYAPDVPYYKKISIDGNPPVATAASTGAPDPHEIMMAPDYSKYFLTCEKTNVVRVLDGHTDSVLAVIPTGAKPQEMAISLTKPYLFVTCTEDSTNPTPACRGTVYVINYNTLAVVQVINGDFYQPHGISVDDRDGKVFIASSNINPNGPAPHHASACDGRVGWYSVYDLNTLAPVNNKRYQTTVMPYSVATRFRN